MLVNINVGNSFCGAEEMQSIDQGANEKRKIHVAMSEVRIKTL